MREKSKKKVDKLITIKEAAEMLGVCSETLRRWDRDGKLRTKRHPMNNYRVYKLSEVSNLKEKLYE